MDRDRKKRGEIVRTVVKYQETWEDEATNGFWGKGEFAVVFDEVARGRPSVASKKRGGTNDHPAARG